MDQLPTPYDPVRLLGAGGMGRVWLARDRATGAEVAVKVFAPGAGADVAAARYLFAREFWALTTFRHPRLVAARAWAEAADGTPAFVMDLVPGEDLAATLAGGPVAEATVRGWLPEVLGALAHLHGRGWLHGDLKPHNLRIGPDGRATLMDLGLVRPSGRADEAVRGTLRYLAPEVIRGGAADARSDLYALGVLLYEALSGQAPFADAQGFALARAHLATPPVPLGRVAPGTTPEMEAVVMRLLAKEPAARPADAAAVLAQLGLAADATLGQALLGAPLIGREAALAAWEELLGADAPAEATLLGGPGTGKTRLLGELRVSAQLEGRPLLAARGLGPQAPPYEAIAPWLRALAPLAQGPLARWAAVLARVLGPSPGLLAPEALAAHPAPPLEGPAERARLHAAVAALAEAAPDGVWLLDDADQLDDASAALAAQLRRTTAWGRRLWIEARRGAPGGAGHGGGRAIALRPLTRDEVAALTGAMLGAPAPADVADRLAELSGGSPAAAEALLVRWVRAGALRREGARWVVEVDASLEAPGGLAEALGAEPASLPAASLALARAAAVLGATGLVADVCAVAGAWPEGEALAGLAALEAAGFLSQAGGLYRLTRPARAEALLAEVEPAALRAMHAAAAQARARAVTGPADPAAPLGDVLALAEHLLAGPAPAEALPWLEAGARRAVGIGALDRAEALVARALACPDVPPAARPGLLALRALVARVRGDLDAALADAEAAVAGLAAADDPGLARERVSLGVLLQLKGRYAEASAMLAAGIAAADARGDAFEAARGGLYAGRVAYFAGQPAEALARLEPAVAWAYAANAPAALAAALALRGYLLATGEAVGRPAGLAALEEAIALARAIGDEVELVDALNMRGNLRLATGDLPGAADDFRAGLAAAERLGLGSEIPILRLNLAAAALTRGQVGEGLAEARAAVALARDQGRGFPESYGLALEGAALAAGGAPGAGLAALDAALARAAAIGNRYVELPILAWRAETLVGLGRFAAARETLQAAELLARETGNDEQRAHLARVALALAALAPAAPGEAHAAAAAAAELADPLVAAHAARWALRALIDAGDLPAAAAALAGARQAAAAAALDGLAAELQLEAGHVAWAEGDRPGAAQAFRAAEAEARALGLRALAIDALACAAAADPAAAGARAGDAAAAFESLSADLDGPARAAYLAHPGRRALADALDPGAGLPLARLRRLAELIADVTAARGVDEVMARALGGFAELAEADRAFLLLYDGLTLTDQVSWGRDADQPDAFSASLAFKALWSDEPLWVEDVAADAELGGQASVQALALRSVLGVPLHDGERTIGVVLADSRHVNPRFGPAERECARALASHTAAMLGAARALARLAGQAR